MMVYYPVSYVLLAPKLRVEEIEVIEAKWLAQGHT